MIQDLIDALTRENNSIIEDNPKLKLEFDWSPDAYRLQHNEEMIVKLKRIVSTNDSLSDLIPTKKEAKEELDSRLPFKTQEKYYVEQGWMDCYKWLVTEILEKWN